MTREDVDKTLVKPPETASKAKEAIDVARDKLSDFNVLRGEYKEYSVAGKIITQKPLVLRDFGRLFEHVLEMLSILITVNPEIMKSGAIEIDTEKISPQFILSIASGSADMMEKIYDIVAMVTKTDREFLLDNLSLKQFTDIIADTLELNDLKEIIANFSRMGTQVRQYLQPKK